jgi:hypothetical protein
MIIIYFEKQTFAVSLTQNNTAAFILAVKIFQVSAAARN